ncbi:hypothetical protein, partial [Fluviicola sp.]|uniref:hypothetical protein n=1 Tax=Fluviicola sp. TaxID=1917219 RepID=UPI0028380ED4
MKTRIRYLLLLFLLFVNGLIAQNVSTGLDPVYAPTPVGGLDSWWQITAGPSGAASAYPISALREATYGTFWQPTPMSSTNACWIDATGSNVSTLGDYTFERTFTVSPFDASIVADFGMGWDDLLLSAELVPPSGPIIPLTVPIGTPNQYWVGPSVNHTVTSPVAGIWKIRVVVRFVDSVGGFILSGEVKHCPKLIISTGVDHTGTAVAVGAVDPDWIISAGPGGSVTHRVASFSDWQSDPVSSTNACWINSTGTYNDPVGIETFDRDFVIPSGISSFTTAFGVAWDGELLSLELVPPSGPAIPLTVPGAPPYTVSPNIDYTVSSPVPGTWKVRAKVQFTDQLGGFILSGQISIPCSFAPPLPCDCSSLNADFDYVLNADCSGHFVGSTQSTCFSDVKYEWSVDGSMVGAGQIFDYPFTTNGAHIVCLRVRTILADGQECVKEICKTVDVQCSPCNCQGLVADMKVLLDACHGNFQAIAQGNSCMQNFGYEWSVNGAVVGTGPVMAFNFPGAGMYVVCLRVTTILADGQECEQKVCKDVKVDNCTSCDCSSLNADFDYALNADCSGHFVGSSIQSSCFIDVKYEWSVDGSIVGTGQIFDYPFTTNGTHVVCLKITTTLSDGQQCEQQICKDVQVQCSPCNCEGLVADMNVLMDACHGNFQAIVQGNSCMQKFGY